MCYRSGKGRYTRITKGKNDMDPRWSKYLYGYPRAMDVEGVKLFYEMYPNSDPKYWSHFKFVKQTKGGKLVSIDVYYRSDRGIVRIIKGKNDRDARWRKYLHSYSPKDRTWEDLASTENLHPLYDYDVVATRVASSLGERGRLSDYPVDRRSTREGSTMTSEDSMVVAIIGGTSAYILWNYVIVKRSKDGRRSSLGSTKRSSIARRA